MTLSTIRFASAALLGTALALSPGFVRAAPSSGVVPAQPTEHASTPDDMRAQSATMYRGRAVADAGVYLSMYGGTAVIMSGIYTQCGQGDTAGVCAPGFGLGLAAGGLAYLLVGTPLLVSGMRRLKDPKRWLAKRPARVRKMRLLAERKHLRPLRPGDVAKLGGDRRARAGSITLLAAGVTQGIAVGVTPLSFGAGMGLSVAGVGLLATGIGLSVSGRRRAYAQTQSVAVSPTVVTGAAGSRLPGVAATGRF